MQLVIPELAYIPQVEALSRPGGYRGLYAFHKYWGKKPSEPIRYLIEHLCPEGGLVVDPFMGSGIAAIEALQVGRRVVGIDINPAAIRITKLLVSPPTSEAVSEAFRRIKSAAKAAIESSYAIGEGGTASHFLWVEGRMIKVWQTNGSGHARVETEPTPADLELLERFDGYTPRMLRQPRFFNNARINASDALTLHDLFTGRALRNIELLLAAIEELPEEMREALRLSLTAAVGQMSKMVFAITGRGKTTGAGSDRIEVGSWVIGFWRPAKHFEVNVWNCFERRVKKLIKALSGATSKPEAPILGDIQEVNASVADCALINGNTLDRLPELQDGSVDLFITDPPHSDRIPYLELSELWNMILGETPDYASEIIVSNAKERSKGAKEYTAAMTKFLEIATTKLNAQGSLVLFFNARSESSWKFFENFRTTADSVGMNYNGCFPLVYSAGSVVQDNRKGALKTDYGLVFSRAATVGQRLRNIPGWMSDIPVRG
ncbi:MAG: DNA adenine methylase [Flavobacteriales bacterium]|jgi:hypothetical protein|nr:DNA adenine methylase [Flavobacteriales bacterium]